MTTEQTCIASDLAAAEPPAFPPGLTDPEPTALLPETAPVRDVLRIDGAQLHQHLDRVRPRLGRADPQWPA